MAGTGVNLTAAIIAVDADETQVFVIDKANGGGRTGLGLPSGPFTSQIHGTLDAGLRAWVADQAGIELGGAEQLFSIAEDAGISIGYLGLARIGKRLPATGGQWLNWYTLAPWEDWRRGRPAILTATIEPFLRARIEQDKGNGQAAHGPVDADRTRFAFGLEGAPWHEERVLKRFEVLQATGYFDLPNSNHLLHPTHAHVLAAAFGRLRARIKVRPVVFELMDEQFTLFELQKTVEAILGPHLHKQNFRRLVESGGLVEATGNVRSNTGGRPAKLFRYRNEVLWVQ